MIIGVCTGGFDPLHIGHVRYIKAAGFQCDHLVVGVNSDEWLVRKKGEFFMRLPERMEIIGMLKQVHDVYDFNDNDGSAIDLLRTLRKRWPFYLIRFMNGGDRTHANIPEMAGDVERVEFMFGIGGDVKVTSSSKLLNRWRDI